MLKNLRKPVLSYAIFVLFLAFITGCGSNDSADGGGVTASTVTGTWAGNYQTTGSSTGNTNYNGSLTLKFTQSGTVLVGTATGTIAGVVNGSNTNTTFTNQQVSGTVSGTALNFTIFFGQYQVAMTGTVSSNTTTITGNWSGDFTATGADTATGTWQVIKQSSSTT